MKKILILFFAICVFNFNIVLCKTTKSITIIPKQNNLTVYIDNEIYDTISKSVTIYDLSAGIYVLRFEKEGYISKGRIINLSRDNNIQLIIKLNKNESEHLYKKKKKNRKVIAHYMQWFQHRVVRKEEVFRHWQWYGRGEKHDPETIKSDGLRDIAAIHYPIIGPYDSADEDVIEYHILTAKLVGIDGFVTDWYGPDNYIDTSFRLLINLCEKYDFQAGLCYEEKIAFPDYRNPKNREEALKIALNDFKYIIENYTHRKHYLQYDDSALLMMFLNEGKWPGYGNKIFKKNELRLAINYLDKNNCLFVRQHLWPGFKDLRAGFAWIGGEDYNDWFYNSIKEMRAKKDIDVVIGVVNPGFNDKGVNGWGNGTRITPRKAGKLYEVYWDMIYEYQPEIVQIATWNDFQEGTVIEPTIDDRYTYLNKTEMYISKYKNHDVNIKDNEFPFQIYQLRKILKKRPAKEQQVYKKQLNNIAENVCDWSYKKTKQKLKQISLDLGYEFLNYIEAKDEFDLFKEEEREEIAKELFASVDNLALKCPVQASYEDTEPSNHAVDGDIFTKWLSRYKDNEWFEIDLQSQKYISCVIIDWAASFGKEYFIKTSRDRKNWITVYKQTECFGDLDIIEFPATECRYVRFEGIKRASHKGYSFWEIGIFNNFSQLN